MRIFDYGYLSDFLERLLVVEPSEETQTIEDQHRIALTPPSKSDTYLQIYNKS